MAIILSPSTTKEKKENTPKTGTLAEKKTTDYVKFSFTITYILLLTTGVITFIEAIRTQTPFIRHIFNLETCISVVAGYFYGVFLTHIEYYEREGKTMDWSELTQTRYIDWAITTPMMLLALCLVLSKHVDVKIHLLPFLSIIGLNYFMLLCGFLGEIQVWERLTANVLGFFSFFTMFGLIYYWYVSPKYSQPNRILYFIYLFIWSLYGIVYMFQESTKNILTNLLDCTAKCFIGLGLWVYYTRIIQN